MAGNDKTRTPVIYSVTDPSKTSRKWFLGWQGDDGIHRSGNDPSWTEEEMAVLFALVGAPMPKGLVSIVA